MNLQVTIIEIPAALTGISKKGNQWLVQEFIAEYGNERYQRKVCFQLYGEEKAELIKPFKVGDTISVDFDIESNEFNGKWFSKCNAWRLSALNSSGDANTNQEQESASETQENNLEPEWSF